MATNTDLNTIGSSKYDIYSKLLDLCASSEYITDQNNFENIDFLKTGLFGYITESLALIMRDSSFHKTMVYRENFLNTAIMPQSIYNFAKMFNVSVIDAKPSTRYAEITINVNVIDQIISNTTGSIQSYKTKYGIAEASNFMVLDKINPIIAGEYYFSLEHSIEIYKNTTGKYVVKYCLNEQDKTTEFGNYSQGGLINTSYITNGTDKYLSFKVLVAQYKTVETSKIITGSSFIDTKTHEFTYDGQLCGMNLTYTKGNTTEDVELKFSNIELNTDTESSNKIAYYSLTDTNTLEIMFVSNKVAGLPQAGGSLQLKTFITEGFNGNISYNGDAVFLIKQDDFKSLPISVTLSTDILTSGADQTSLGSLKNIIVDKLATRNTIITENDLNTWFATQSKLLTDVSNAGITFRKEKDNLLKRTFSVFLLLRDGALLDEYMSQKSEVSTTVSSSYISNVVPTNTIDVRYLVSNSNAKTIHIYPYQDIKYDINTKTFTFNDAISTETDYVYRTPFNIVLNKEYNQISYFYLETEDSAELEFKSLTTMDQITLIPTQVTVEHINPVSNTDVDNYVFRFYVSSDSDLSSKNISSMDIYFDSYKTTLNGSYQFTKIDNDDEDTESSLSNYMLEIKAEYDNIITTNENVQIALKFNGSSETTNVKSQATIALDLKFADNTFSGKFGSTDSLVFFTALDDVICSDLVVGKDANGTITSYTLKDIPVVASYWIQSSINKKWFIRQLFVFINMLKANIDKLETTTFFNIKFRNSYGLSHYYNSLNTQLRLNLTIYIDKDKADATVSNLSYQTSDTGYTSLENEIRDYIRVAVDNANENGELVISKIIMNTQASYYNFIKHIDFNGLNGTFNQYISSINTDDMSYPLEYFSLDYTLEDDTSSGSKISRLEKDIVFIYE